MSLVSRFAPSPTGYLHLGHAYSALLAYRAASEASGRFLLRIEDIDTTRCRPQFEAAICEDLAWLGLRWECPVRRQSEHLDEYQAALNQLAAMGVVYRCFKTRREIIDEIARAPHGPGEGPDGAIYPGPDEPMDPAEERRRVDEGQSFAWRLSLRAVRERLGHDLADLTFREEGAGPDGETGDCAIRPDLLGDVILGRKDIGTSYHLSVTLDDALQGVTHVVRGQDLFHSTSVHRLLQALLDLPTPVYRHHGLLTDDEGRRLSKRDRSITLRSLRAEGVRPDDVHRRVGL